MSKMLTVFCVYIEKISEDCKGLLGFGESVCKNRSEQVRCTDLEIFMAVPLPVELLPVATLRVTIQTMRF